MRLRTALPAAALALSLPLLAVEKPSPRELERGFDALLGATAEARSEGKLGPDGNRARDYLADLVARDATLAKCLPKAGTLEIAALLTLSRPAAPLSRFGGDPDLMVRDAVLDAGRCRIDEESFLPNMLRAAASASPSYRATIRDAVTALIRSEAVRDPAYAACLAKPEANRNLYLALAGYFATLEDGAAPSASAAQAAVKGAANRLCAASPQPATYLRDASKPERPPAVAGCKRTRFTVISKKAPVFPRRAVQADIEQASLVVHINVGADGIPHSIRILRTEPAVLHGVFDGAARALLDWKFAADECPFIAEIPLDFRLPD